MWAPERLQLSQHCPSMAVYHKALQVLLHMVPHGWQLPQPSCPTTGCSSGPSCSYRISPWAIPPSGLIHCCPVGSPMAASGDLCGARGLYWDGLLLCRPLLDYKELLCSRSTSCSGHGCRATSLSFLIPLSQLLLHSSFSLP